MQGAFMQVVVGNHMKVNAPTALRTRLYEFYVEVLGCHTVAAPSPQFDLFEFTGGFVVGLFYGDDSEVLSEQDQLKATWLELKTSAPAALKTRLLKFGVRPVDYPDPSRFYFQAPGGLVWRVAPLDGGT
jgi:hypothetical protein